MTLEAKRAIVGAPTTSDFRLPVPEGVLFAKLHEERLEPFAPEVVGNAVSSDEVVGETEVRER